MKVKRSYLNCLHCIASYHRNSAISSNILGGHTSIVDKKDIFVIVCFDHGQWKPCQVRAIAYLAFFVLILNVQTSRCILAANTQFTSIIASTLSYQICCCEVPYFLVSNESLEIWLHTKLKIFVPKPIKYSGQEDMSQNSRFCIVNFWICSQNTF